MFMQNVCLCGVYWDELALNFIKLKKTFAKIISIFWGFLIEQMMKSHLWDGNFVCMSTVTPDQFSVTQVVSG